MTTATEQQENSTYKYARLERILENKWNRKALIGELIVLTQMAKYEIETITGATQTNETRTKLSKIQPNNKSSKRNRGWFAIN